MQKVIDERDHHDTGKYDGAPINRLKRDFSCQWEEGEDPYDGEEEDGDRFNARGDLTYAPARRGQWFPAPPLEAQAEDGDDVGSEECGDAE